MIGLGGDALKFVPLLPQVLLGGSPRASGLAFGLDLAVRTSSASEQRTGGTITTWYSPPESAPRSGLGTSAVVPRRAHCCGPRLRGLDATRAAAQLRLADVGRRCPYREDRSPCRPHRDDDHRNRLPQVDPSHGHWRRRSHGQPVSQARHRCVVAQWGERGGGGGEGRGGGGAPKRGGRVKRVVTHRRKAMTPAGLSWPLTWWAVLDLNQ